MNDDIGGVWRTVGGRRIFIKDGQDLASAMKNSGKFSNEKSIKTLTKDEMYAINKYISSKAYILNEKLRNDIDLSESEIKIVQDLDSALNKLEKYEGPVKRSLSLDDEDVEYFLKSYDQGNIINYKAYTSTTTGKPYNPEERVQMNITSKNGKNLISYNPEEQEILFGRNTKFIVKSVDKTDDFFIRIELEEKDD